ncbi:unnamed protein product [Candidatus Paraburkholderia kirkii UZHbot1]|uniref:WGS project CAFE00000000 data, contig bkir_c294 n=5 Tax=Candidatus Paraburkholderia kirkii UZHbot1 TaxID=1055526 RepID=U3UAW4_9BURK|nr:unnamed protein product [Candidatus Paraburkholderia kirkii UZHbot1]
MRSQYRHFTFVRSRPTHTNRLPETGVLRQQWFDQVRQRVDRFAHVDWLATEVGTNIGRDPHRALPRCPSTKRTMRSACTPLSAMRTPASDSVTRSPEGDVGGVSAGVEIDVKAGSSSRRAMTHAASAVTARGLALAGAAPANFLRHNPKSADSKAWFATEAPSANAAGPPRFHHLPPACLALAGATCHSHSSSLNRIVVHRVTPITTMAKPSHIVYSGIQDGLR